MTPLDWVIAGGESGPGARPMHPDWARSLRDQCAAAGVPFFFKQWGEWWPMSQAPEDLPLGDYPSTSMKTNGVHTEDGAMFRIGKKHAGRLLDGVEHSAWPAGK